MRGELKIIKKKIDDEDRAKKAAIQEDIVELVKVSRQIDNFSEVKIF